MCPANPINYTQMGEIISMVMGTSVPASVGVPSGMCIIAPNIIGQLHWGISRSHTEESVMFIKYSNIPIS